MVADEVQDRLALRQLVEDYARAADRRDAVAFADVFTDDGVLVTGRGDIRGRDELLRVAPKLDRYRVTMHLVGNHHVTFAEGGHHPRGTGDDVDARTTGDVDSDRAGGSHPAETATGSTYCVAHHVYDTDNVARAYVMYIRYDDTYRRVGGGWRIAERRLDLLWDEDHRLHEP